MPCDYRTIPRLLMSRLLMVLVLPCCAASSLGQEPNKEPNAELEKLDATVKTFLEGVSGNDAETAYKELLAGTQLLKQEAFKELVEKTLELKKYGKCHEFEQIGVKLVGKDLVLLKYLYKCTDYPVVWYFNFYRTPTDASAPSDGDTWRVVTVRFDTRLELLWLSP